MALAIFTAIVAQISGGILLGAYGGNGLIMLFVLDVFMLAVCFYEIELKERV